MGYRQLAHCTRSHLYFALVLALILALASPVTPLVLQNITLPLPLGTSNHETPGLLCTPTQPLDLLLFYLLNYVAHATTVLIRPGERGDDYFVSVIGSLLFPALGLYRGIEAILSGAIWVRNDDLRKAAKSGALCIVVRGADWRPVNGEALTHTIYRGRTETTAAPEPCLPSPQTRRPMTGDTLTDGTSQEQDSTLHIIPFSPPSIFTRFGCPVFVHRRIIHGTHSLPTGYRFAILPHDAHFTPPPSSSSACQSPNIEVSANYNTVKALIALGQSAYAVSTLYRARGDQISQFGFAAFGLTVAPYAVMSMVNLLGNLCRPDYPSLYMVESGVMDEARGCGGVFDGAVARVCEDEGVNVCSCGFADGEEVEVVRFEATKLEKDSGDGEEKLEAHFSTTDPLAHSKQRTRHGEKHAATHDSSLLTHVYAVAPLPEKQNYTRTKDAALLLVPCHTPLIRSTRSLQPPESPLPRPSLSALTLHHTYPPGLFCRHRTWRPHFTPSYASHLARRWRVTKYLLLTLIALLPLLINGLMTKFKRGSIPAAESNTWAIYTLQWLFFGVCMGLWWVLEQEGKEAMTSVRVQLGPWARIASYVVSASPAVGGFVVVGQMLLSYGSCMWVG